MTITVGVLALQGAFLEHLVLLRKAADYLRQDGEGVAGSLAFTEVRNVRDLSICDALIIPGGESTTIALVAAQSGLLEPLRDFVK
jgi:pyridoxal 5'-phosphate synthase pdxT subunit